MKGAQHRYFWTSSGRTWVNGWRWRPRPRLDVRRFRDGVVPGHFTAGVIDLLGFTGLDMKLDGRENLVGQWNSLAIAAFLIGAATGGVLFGWLGDRLGRVRSMSLSILIYALCSGLGGFAIAPGRLSPSASSRRWGWAVNGRWASRW